MKSKTLFLEGSVNGSFLNSGNKKMIFTEEIMKVLINECLFSFARSSGPGGQNVNKVNSQVELRFSVTSSTVFSEVEKAIITEKLKNKINSNGELIITAQESRSQPENKEIALDKFFRILKAALRTQNKRIKTAPSRASIRQRLEDKKNIAQKKEMRKTPDF